MKVHAAVVFFFNRTFNTISFYQTVQPKKVFDLFFFLSEIGMNANLKTPILYEAYYIEA